jgi:GNAT superfamily N-acetyltransferase
MPHGLSRCTMRVALRPLEDAPVHGLRAPAEADVPALGRLLYCAYLGTVDFEEETIEQATEEVRKTFRGDYGPFDPGCSTVCERAGDMLCATLVTHWQARPFVAFTMTDASAKRQGLARACMIRSMNRLLAAGEHELRLVVTLANAPARSLYDSLGFAIED